MSEGTLCTAVSADRQKWYLLMLNDVRTWRKIIKDTNTKRQQRSYLHCKTLCLICVDKLPFNYFTSPKTVSLVILYGYKHRLLQW